MHRWAGFVILSAVAVGAGVLSAQTLTAALGITDARAREAVFDSFVSGAVSTAGKADAFTAASSQGRVAIVQAALAVARAFIESDDFARRYADHREANGPGPLPPPASADAVLAQQRSAFEEQVEGMRKQYGEVTAAQRETLEKGFEDVRRRFTEMEAGDARATLEAALREQRAEQVAAHQAAVAALDAAYPPDPRALVAARLREFLALAATVDFTAQVAVREGKRRFVDPAFEAKPHAWKMLFRAGKPACDAATAFASAWLGELERRGVK